MTTTLSVQMRDTATKPDRLRAEGYIPAVYYGKEKESTPITIDKGEFYRAWQTAGESTVVSLKSENETVNTVISDVQLDPVSEMPIHADFYVFERGQRIEVNVPLEFVGESAAVKEKGAVLVKVLHELRVEAEPANLPGGLEVDIAALSDLDSQILAKDITLPDGVELIEDPEEVVASVYEAKEEPEEDEGEEMDISDIEATAEKEEGADESGGDTGEESASQENEGNENT